jgi:hypothetical protein
LFLVEIFEQHPSQGFWFASLDGSRAKRLSMRVNGRRGPAVTRSFLKSRIGIRRREARSDWANPIESVNRNEQTTQRSFTFDLF